MMDRLCHHKPSHWYRTPSLREQQNPAVDNSGENVGSSQITSRITHRRSCSLEPWHHRLHGQCRAITRMALVPSTPGAARTCRISARKRERSRSFRAALISSSALSPFRASNSPCG